MNKRPLIGVSLGSYLPISVIAPLWAMRHMATYADFVQTLPVHGLHKAAPSAYPLPVLLTEDAWDSEPSLAATIQAKLRGDKTAGTGWDYAFFGPTAYVEETMLSIDRAVDRQLLPFQRIVHSKPTAAAYYEVNPGSFMRAREIGERFSDLTTHGRLGGICLDTYHLSRNPTEKEILLHARRYGMRPDDAFYGYDQSFLGDWRQSIPEILDGSQEPLIVHIQPDRERDEYRYVLRYPDLGSFGDTELAKKLYLILKYRQPAAFVIEALPMSLKGRLSWRRQAENLRQFTNLIRRALEPYYQ